MNPEKLQDALNLLDDDLIAPTERLRGRRGIRWYHLGALAACLAVVCALSVYALSRDLGSNDTALQQDGVAEMIPETDSFPSNGEGPKNQLQKPEDDLIDDSEEVTQVHSLLLSVLQVEEDRFTATVVEACNGYAEGAVVTVLLTEDTCLMTDNNGEVLWPEGAQHLVPGRWLVVEYQPGPEQDTICADRISFVGSNVKFSFDK